MAALTGDRADLVQQSPEYSREDFGKRSTEPGNFYVGGMVMKGPDGLISECSASSASSSNVVVGIAMSRTSQIIANPSHIDYRAGLFNMKTDGTIVDGMHGNIVFALDDQTVTVDSSSGKRAPAGRLDRVDPVLGPIVSIGMVPLASGSVN